MLEINPNHVITYEPFKKHRIYPLKNSFLLF